MQPVGREVQLPIQGQTPRKGKGEGWRKNVGEESRSLPMCGWGQCVELHAVQVAKKVNL